MVYFVGAGPGDPELMTLKGKRLLEKADMVIYTGSLINTAVLSYTKASAQCFDSKNMDLRSVLALFDQAAESGLDVVRLHTGDTCLYGAIREQIDHLRKKGIPFEICPGVSSFSGAAAALETEYTLPGITQSVVITRMAGRTPVPEKEKLAAFAATGATLVLFLSAGLSDKIRAELMEAGVPADMPAAVVFKATWPDQRVVRTTIDRLPEVYRNERSELNPSLIIIGKAAALQADYDLSRLYAADFDTFFRKGEK